MTPEEYIVYPMRDIVNELERVLLAMSPRDKEVLGLHTSGMYMPVRCEPGALESRMLDRLASLVADAQKALPV